MNRIDPTLDSIALTTNTDKSSRFHDYCSVYQSILPPRDKPIRLLEIGILGGDSLLMWSTYFEHPMSVFLGVDLHDRNFQSNDRRIMTAYGDSSDPRFLGSLNGPFDVVIEDGGHFCSHQVNAYVSLWHKITQGGMMIVEDVHTVHSPQHCDMHINIIEYFSKIAISMQDTKGAEGCAKHDPSHAFSDIESIEYRKGLIIVRKRA